MPLLGMPSIIIYGGVEYHQVRRAVYCKKCQETIESRHQHDFKMCSCGSTGIDWERILGVDAEPRHMYRAEVRGKRLWLPVSSHT